MSPSPTPVRIAVIGSGASAAGALLGMEQRFPDAEIWLIERQDQPDSPPMPPPSAEPDARYWQDLYRYIRLNHGVAFPPAKSHFGARYPGYPVPDWGRLWESRERGGLTRYWGGVTLPFGAADLRQWPIGESDLAPFYDRIGREMGICGSDDGQDSRPGLRPVPLARRFLDAVAARPKANGLGLHAFVPRLALETREEEASRCTYTGWCMAGCPRSSFYSASATIDRMIGQGFISKVISGKVQAIDTVARTLSVASPTGQSQQGPFDLILVAAGCLGTAQILLGSLPALPHLEVLDNPVFTFPIFAPGGGQQTGEQDGYFALTNACVTVTPEDTALPSASVQVYPAMDHLWQSLLPGVLWPAMAPVGRFLRRHLLIGRLYLHSDYGSAIRMRLNADGSPALSLARSGGMPAGLWPSIRQSLSSRGFLVPRLPPMRQKTSSHYAGAFPYGTGGLAADGRLHPGIYLCDSVVFPNGPAVSPTLTIMANAMRTASSAIPAQRRG